MIRVLHLSIVLLLCSLGVLADDAVADPEIEYLLVTVGQSGCTFIRNGDEHPAKDAESHLRLKYRNGRTWVHSADQFIRRLASKSSWTGKVYYIRCGSADPQPSADWLFDRLAEYRKRD